MISSEHFKFDKRHCSSKLLLTKGRTVKHSGTSDCYASIFGDKAVKVGKHYWEIVISKLPNKTNQRNDLFVGVCERTMPTSYYAGQSNSSNTHGWGYYSGDGRKFNSSSGSYGVSYGKVGDRIGIQLDCDAGKLSFFVNKNNPWFETLQ